MRVITVAMAMMRIWSMFVGVSHVVMFVFMNMSFRLVRFASVAMFVVTIVMPVRMCVSHRCVRVKVLVFLASEEDRCESHEKKCREERPRRELPEDG